jgi:iron complex outermembrane recepter protein
VLNYVKISRALLKTAVSCASIGVAHAALAQSTVQTANVGGADKDAASLYDGDIIVTARRRSERLQDTPVSVTAFSERGLEQKMVGNLLGIARFTPNVEISNGRPDGGGSSLNAYIRGVGQQDFLFPTDPGVGLYLDDVYLARTIGGTLDLSDVERIEVLRGPQGTLYGKNTIGGAIKIVTRRPQLEGAWTGSIEGITGSFSRSDLRLFATGPLIEGKLGLKIAVAGLRRDGYGQRLRQNYDLGDEGKIVGRAALRWKPTDDIDITLQGDYQQQRQHGPVGTLVNRIPSDVDLSGLVGLLAPAFPGAVDPTPQNPFLFDDFYNALIVPTLNSQLGLPAGTRYDSRFITGNPRTTNATDPSRDNNDIWGTQLTADFNLGNDVALKSITAYRHITANIARDGDHTPYPVAATATTITQSQFSQELQLSGKSTGNRLDWLVGGYFMRENAFDNNSVKLFSGLYEVLNPVVPFLYGVGPCVGSGVTANCTTPGAFTFDYFPQNKIRIDTWAVFGQATFKLNDQLALTAGARYSRDTKNYVQDHQLQQVRDPKFGPGLPGYLGTVAPFQANGLARLVGPRNLKDSWSSFTPKLGVDFKLTDDTLLYASWSRGFKSGGWSPRPTQQNATDLSYDPETLSTFELGSKNSALDGKLIINLAAFYSIYEGVQVTTVGSSTTGALLLLTRNIGQARIYGVEAEVTAKPVRGLELNLAGGYLHSAWNRFNAASCTPAVFTATKGNFCDAELSLSDRLVDSPSFTLNVGGQYSVPLNAIGSITFRTDASYRSEVWKDPYNLGRGPNAFGQIDPRQTLPATGSYYGVTQRTISQPGYWLVNLRATFETDDRKWSAGLGVTNLFDRSYYTSIQPVTTFGYDEGYVGRPREWTASVKYSF